MVSGSNLRGKEQWLQVFQPRVLGSADSGPAKLLGAQAQGKTQLLVRNKQKAGSSLDFYCRDNDHDQKQLGEDFFFFFLHTHLDHTLSLREAKAENLEARSETEVMRALLTD